MFEHLVNFVKSQYVVLLSSLIIIVSIFLLAWLFNRSLHLLQKNRGLAPPLVSTLKSIVKWIVGTIGLLLVLQQFGILPNVWAAFLAILAALAVGLVAGWSVLSNILCTFLILLFRPFRISDEVDMPSENIKGEVIDLNFMHTTLRNDLGHLIRVPNNLFFLKPIVCLPGKQAITLYEQLQADKPVSPATGDEEKPEKKDTSG